MSAHIFLILIFSTRLEKNINKFFGTQNKLNIDEQNINPSAFLVIILCIGLWSNEDTNAMNKTIELLWISH